MISGRTGQETVCEARSELVKGALVKEADRSVKSVNEYLDLAATAAVQS
jgi:hypothetical protein